MPFSAAIHPYDVRCTTSQIMGSDFVCGLCAGGQAGVPLDELLRFTAEEVTELLKEMKVGVIARRRITEEHALEVERLPAGEAGARAREQLVRCQIHLPIGTVAHCCVVSPCRMHCAFCTPLLRSLLSRPSLMSLCSPHYPPLSN